MKDFTTFLDESTLASLKKHPMWSDSDYNYFKEKVIITRRSRIYGIAITSKV